MNPKTPYVIFLFCLAFTGLYFVPDQIKESWLTSPFEIVYLPSFAAFGKAFLAGFLHLELSHLLGNITLFCLLGFFVEGHIGHWKTFWVLIAAGIGALAIHIGYMPANPIRFLGASGFVFGLLAAYTKILFRRRD